MWRGTYTHWNPVPKYEGKELDVEAVHDDWEGFRIWLRQHSSEPMIIVKFDDVRMYVNSNESYRLSQVEFDSDRSSPHAFWEVVNSGLVEEFNRQSEGICKDENIRHFAFLSGEDCIDVLSPSEPSFEICI